MNMRNIVGVVLVAGIFGAVVTDANAQGKDRTEVQQQQPQDPMNSMQDSGTGSGSSGTHASGAKDTPANPSSSDGCVGPVSFCNIYFGS
jgi:hypothetical protein